MRLEILASYPHRLSRTFRTTGWLVLFIIGLVAFFVAFAPLSFVQPDYGLDPSWRAVLGEAARLGYNIGSDIIFTGGPLSFVYTRYFNDQITLYVAAYALIIFASAALIATLSARHERYLIGLLVCLGAAAVSDFNDALFFAVVPLTALLALPPIRKTENVLIVIGLLAAATASLAKFSVVPIAVASFVSIDLVRGFHRQTPYLSVAFVILIFVLYSVLVGPKGFVDFVRGSLETSTGYPDAMAIEGPTWQIVLYAVAAMCFVSAMIMCEIRALKLGHILSSISAARFVVIAASLFISFKGGFIRQDMHILLAWAGLTMTALIYALAAPKVTKDGAAAIAYSSVLLAGLTAAFVAMAGIWMLLHGHEFSQILARHLATLPANSASLGEMIANPTAWTKARTAEKEAAWQNVRAKLPLPQLAGTVDAIPSVQSSILAHWLTYAPRYTIQEFTTYTKHLIDRNRTDIVDRGPDYLLFDPALMNIDGRLPAMAEGPLWPDILRLYELQARSDSVLILRRRSKPLADSLLGPSSSTAVRFSDLPYMPDNQTPQFMTARIRKTIFGMLWSAVFRLPPVYIRLVLSDGSQERYRILPAILEEGVILNPLVKTSDDYLALSHGDLTRLRRVLQYSFETNQPSSYKPVIDLTFRPVRLDLLQTSAGCSQMSWPPHSIP